MQIKSFAGITEILFLCKCILWFLVICIWRSCGAFLLFCFAFLFKVVSFYVVIVGKRRSHYMYLLLLMTELITNFRPTIYQSVLPRVPILRQQSLF